MTLQMDEILREFAKYIYSFPFDDLDKLKEAVGQYANENGTS